jgi:hypothetical protein
MPWSIIRILILCILLLLLIIGCFILEIYRTKYQYLYTKHSTDDKRHFEQMVETINAKENGNTWTVLLLYIIYYPIPIQIPRPSTIHSRHEASSAGAI